MKKLICGAILILISMSFTACSKQSVELSQREIVDAVSIDCDDSGYTVCAVAFRISADDKKNESYKFYKSKGETLSESFNQLEQNTLSSLMFENNSVILLGKSVCEKKYSDTINYLFGNYKGAVQTEILGTASSAEEFISSIASSGNSFTQIIENFTSAVLKNAAISNPMYKCAPKKNGVVSMAFLPIVEAVEFEQPDAQKTKIIEVRLKGLSIFSNDRYLNTVNDELMTGIMLVQNRIEKIPIEIASGKRVFSAELEKPRLTVFKDTNKTNEYTVRCSLCITTADSVSSLSEVERAAVKNEAAKYIRYLLTNAIQQTSSVYKIDILNLQWYRFLESDNAFKNISTKCPSKLQYEININF
ncbi:MAG: Ger(x)C family spore germination C-terminal domain-containing protein [Oscillospiraceae bacterium]